jgi:hypothetical protein
MKLFIALEIRRQDTYYPRITINCQFASLTCPVHQLLQRLSAGRKPLGLRRPRMNQE